MLERKFPKAAVSAKAERYLRRGHLWVYDTEVKNISGDFSDGDLVDVFSEKDKYLGTGFINRASKIRIRIISKNANDKFDSDFWRRRIEHAINYRVQTMGDDISACRLIFGDADLFSGLTVDRFENILVAETLSLGIEKIKNMLFPLLIDVLSEKGIEIDALYERCDSPIRKLEGMKTFCGFYKCGNLKTDLDGKLVITENNIKFNVDYINGQKTGYFLDQKYNRRAVAKISRGLRVLDCFTHTGGFALNAAAAGAASVCALDISADAIELTKANAKLNSLESKMSFVCADVFDYLSELDKSRACNFDFIILDPPAFTKSSATAKNAVRGYKEINYRAMKILPRGGYLATCSCSHFMSDEMFRKMLADAAGDAGVSLRQIEGRQQACDYPILWSMPETDYLKFYIFQIV